MLLKECPHCRLVAEVDASLAVCRNCGTKLEAHPAVRADSAPRREFEDAPTEKRTDVAQLLNQRPTR
jgi:hypothetical protein